MVRVLELVPEHDGDFTVEDPQNSEVVPQNPNLLQQTFKGHSFLVDHCAPQPGSHSDLRSQLDMQFSGAHDWGPKPQTLFLLQHPIAQGFVEELRHVNINHQNFRDQRASFSSPGVVISRRIDQSVASRNYENKTDEKKEEQHSFTTR